MILLLLLQVAHASSCCSSTGITPTTLASCDRLGVAFGLGADVETGGWAWGGAWSGVGDDGGGKGILSAALLGRFNRWMQGGLSLPLDLSVDALDGQTTTGLELGSAALWFDVETPAGWGGPKAPGLALELGLAGEGLTSERPDVLFGQLGARASWVPSAWGAWTNATTRFPLYGEGLPDTDVLLVADRMLGPKARLGLGLSASATWGSHPSVETSLGPTLTLTPDHENRLLLGLRAGLPVAGAGWNAPSRLVASVAWARVLKHVE